MLIKLADGNMMPVEMHKARMVQKINLVPAEERYQAIKEAGYNTFLLKNRHIFIDGLTDSGVNAMSDNQYAALLTTDDSYAGSETFYEFKDAVKDVLGYNYVMNVHQGRAAEHLICKIFGKPGGVVITNYHFTTTKAHIEETAKSVCLELYADEAVKTNSSHPFKGNMDMQRLNDAIKKYGKDKIGYIRMEASTNLLGGQPFSMENFKEVKKACTQNGILFVLDGSLITENAYLITQREKEYENKTVAEVVKEMCSLADIYYMSSRKNTCVRGGCIATNNEKLFKMFEPWLPLYEGFFTYGGMSMREVGAMAVGMREMCDIGVASAPVDQIAYFINKLDKMGIPVVTPPGALGGHIDAKRFAPHLPKEQYIAGSLAAAFFIVSGVRTMERGTISMDRDKEGNDVYAELELMRVALPRRVYSIAHVEYIIDRLNWLYKHRELVGGLKFVSEPPVLRFFLGRLDSVGDWSRKLCDAYKKDFGDKA
ncbi:MAG: tryptophanase [Bacteroidales bacterium]